jgi:hypothetical protein
MTSAPESRSANVANVAATIEPDQLTFFDVEPFEDSLIAAIARAKRRHWYWSSYLRGPWWQWRRAKFLAIYPTCELGPEPASDVHHLDYARLFAEADSDLVALCRFHHDRMHHRTYRGGSRGPGR